MFLIGLNNGFLDEQETAEYMAAYAVCCLALKIVCWNVWASVGIDHDILWQSKLHGRSKQIGINFHHIRDMV